MNVATLAGHVFDWALKLSQFCQVWISLQCKINKSQAVSSMKSIALFLQDEPNLGRINYN